MRQLVQRAAAHVAESPRYRNYPAYSLLIGLIVWAYADWPVDFHWWMAVTQSPSLDTLHLCSILVPLWFGVLLGLVGIFRRPWLARIASAMGVCLALDGLARWHFWPWHPLAEFQELAYSITLGTPIRLMMETFGGNHLTTTEGLALYFFVVYLCVRPLIKRAWGRGMVWVHAMVERWPRLQFMVKTIQ
jgi:hypothetical protein